MDAPAGQSDAHYDRELPDAKQTELKSTDASVGGAVTDVSVCVGAEVPISQQKESILTDGSNVQFTVEVPEFKPIELKNPAASRTVVDFKVIICEEKEFNNDVNTVENVPVKVASYLKKEQITCDGSGDHSLVNVPDLKGLKLAEEGGPEAKVSVSGDVNSDGQFNLVEVPLSADSGEPSGPEQKEIVSTNASSNGGDDKNKSSEQKDQQEASGSRGNVVVKVSKTIKKDLKKRLSLVVKKVIAMQRMTAEKARNLFSKN